MTPEKLQATHARVIRSSDHGDIDGWRRACGCIKTSEKLKQILSTFPAPPPPSNTSPADKSANLESTCISSLCNNPMHACPIPIIITDRPYPPPQPMAALETEEKCNQEIEKKDSKLWRFIAELVSLIQLSVTATALALYYLIYCYMQLVYCTLHTALYFHNADGPMKITIAVVTLTSLVVGFNIIIRLERFIGIIPHAPS